MGGIAMREQLTRQWAQSLVLYSALIRRPQMWHVLWLHGAIEWWATGLAQMKQTSASSSSSSAAGPAATTALPSLFSAEASAARRAWPAASPDPAPAAAAAASFPLSPRPRLLAPRPPRLAPPPPPRFWPWFPRPPPRPRPLELPSFRPEVGAAPSALDMVDAVKHGK